MDIIVHSSSTALDDLQNSLFQTVNIVLVCTWIQTNMLLTQDGYPFCYPGNQVSSFDWIRPYVCSITDVNLSNFNQESPCRDSRNTCLIINRKAKCSFLLKTTTPYWLDETSRTCFNLDSLTELPHQSWWTTANRLEQTGWICHALAIDRLLFSILGRPGCD